MSSHQTDWQWCYENPKDAAAEIDRLQARLTAQAATALDTAALEQALDEVCGESGNAVPVGIPLYSITLPEIIKALYRLGYAQPPAEPVAASQGEEGREVPKLQVFYGAMPESNGKSNWTAILHNGDLSHGITLDRSEYPDRVRYEADRARFLIGELAEEPFILDYDADKHSGYVAQPARQVGGEDLIEACAKICEERRDYYAGDDDGPESRRAGACQNCADVIRWRSGELRALLAQ